MTENSETKQEEKNEEVFNLGDFQKKVEEDLNRYRNLFAGLKAKQKPAQAPVQITAEPIPPNKAPNMVEPMLPKKPDSPQMKLIKKILVILAIVLAVPIIYIVLIKLVGSIMNLL